MLQSFWKRKYFHPNWSYYNYYYHYNYYYYYYYYKGSLNLRKSTVCVAHINVIHWINTYSPHSYADNLYWQRVACLWLTNSCCFFLLSPGWVCISLVFHSVILSFILSFCQHLPNHIEGGFKWKKFRKQTKIRIEKY